jgi:cytochrome c peroxidase
LALTAAGRLTCEHRDKGTVRAGSAGVPHAVSAARGGRAARHALLVVLLAGVAPVAVSSDAPVAVGSREYRWHLPRGFPIPAVPPENPMSDAKVVLGRRLFFEPRLSVTHAYSCASCHDPARAFTDGRAVALGATGLPTANAAMSLANVAYNISFGWSKPTVQSLEAQMLEPLRNQHPVEMGLAGRESAVAGWLSADPEYRAEFAEAFPDSNGRATFDLMVKAIAAFERTLISGHSPFDRYVFEGRHDALNEQAKRGMALFYSARLGCSACHSGFNFAGNWRDAQGATGAASFARNGTSATPMRVPTLRNITLTAPYMHDGRFSTLEAVIDHYQDAGQNRSDKNEPHLQPFVLDPEERAALIAFLHSLTDQEFVAGFVSERTHSLSGR